MDLADPLGIISYLITEEGYSPEMQGPWPSGAVAVAAIIAMG